MGFKAWASNRQLWRWAVHTQWGIGHAVLSRWSFHLLNLLHITLENRQPWGLELWLLAQWVKCWLLSVQT